MFKNMTPVQKVCVIVVVAVINYFVLSFLLKIDDNEAVLGAVLIGAFLGFYLFKDKK